MIKPQTNQVIRWYNIWVITHPARMQLRWCGSEHWSLPGPSSWPMRNETSSFRGLDWLLILYCPKLDWAMIISPTVVKNCGISPGLKPGLKQSLIKTHKCAIFQPSPLSLHPNMGVLTSRFLRFCYHDNFCLLKWQVSLSCHNKIRFTDHLKTQCRSVFISICFCSFAL